MANKVYSTSMEIFQIMFKAEFTKTYSYTFTVQVQAFSIPLQNMIRAQASAWHMQLVLQKQLSNQSADTTEELNFGRSRTHADWSHLNLNWSWRQQVCLNLLKQRKHLLWASFLLPLAAGGRHFTGLPCLCIPPYKTIHTTKQPSRFPKRSTGNYLSAMSEPETACGFTGMAV